MIILEKEKYTAAVIGVGRIGMLLEADPKRIKPATHFGMWASHSQVEFAAVCDNNPHNLDVASSRLPSLKTYSSAEQLLREVKPDIVSISTWKDTHYEMMKLCVDYGVPAIICEKPIAEKREHAREIVDLVNERGIHLFINHRRRFDPLLYTLKDDFKNGLIGEIMQVNIHYVFGLVTTGTHSIDALRFLLKDIAGEMVWVSAFPNTFNHFHPEGDPCIDGFIGFENGLKVAVQSLNLKEYDFFNFEFYGRKGRVTYKNVGRDIEIFQVIESPEHAGFTELSNTPTEIRGGKPRNLFNLLADNVIDALQGKATSLSTGEDSLKALNVLLAMQKSVDSGGTVVEIAK